MHDMSSTEISSCKNRSKDFAKQYARLSCIQAMWMRMRFGLLSINQIQLGQENEVFYTPPQSPGHLTHPLQVTKKCSSFA